MEGKMVRILKAFTRNDDGATMIEYGLIAALVSVVAIAALGLMGNNLSTMYDHVATCLSNAQAGTTC
jgi:pilus assembly protein Flp/PilA